MLIFLIFIFESRQFLLKSVVMKKPSEEENKMFYSTYCPSPVGRLMLASDGENLVGLWLVGQKYFGDTIPEEMVARDDLPIFSAAKNWLDSYFANEKPAIADLSLAPRGRRIPEGGMGYLMRDTLWRDNYLWGYRQENSFPHEQGEHVQSVGGWRCWS